MTTRKKPGKVGGANASTQELMSMASRMAQGRGSFEMLDMGSPKLNEADFKGKWSIDSLSQPQLFAKVRERTKDNLWAEWVLGVWMDFFAAGFRMKCGNAADTKAFLSKHEGYAWERLNQDVWREFLTSSNVVAVWNKLSSSLPGSPTLPVVTILDCEEVEYTNAFGVEKLKIKMKKRALSDEEKKTLGPRYADAIARGEGLVLEPTKGEYFKVLSTAKLGKGLADPRWKSVMFDLSLWELLRIGDWSGAWARKRILSLVRKGHEIKQGNLAGLPNWFYKDAWGKKFKKLLQSHSGYGEVITNFDVNFEYVYLKPEFFDKKVYEAVDLRLAMWAGPAALMLREGQANPEMATVFRAQGQRMRKLVGEFLESILNDPNFSGDQAKEGKRLRVGWSNQVFFNAKLLMSWIEMGYRNGLASGQTSRAAMDLDDDEESELNRDAATRRADFQPPFEAKQGLLQEGGASPEGGRPPKAEGG